FLQAGKRHPVARREGGEHRGDAQSGRGVDDGVEFVHHILRSRTRAMTPPMSNAGPAMSAIASMLAGAPKKPVTAAATAITRAITSWSGECQTSVPARYIAATSNA